MPIPRRLRREPLIEVLWQAVFETTSTMIPGDIMVGLLYANLCKASPGWQLTRLPTAEIPPFIADQDPNLRYTVKYRLQSPRDQILYQIGDRILSVNCRRPYAGWDVFKGKILSVYELLAETSLIPGPIYHNLRYIDLIEQGDMSDLSGLRVSFQVGDHLITNQPVQIRVEIPYQEQTHVLQILSPAQVQLQDGPHDGILLDLETRALSHGDWSKVPEQLEVLHNASKAMFFEQILKPEVTDRFEPEY